MLPREVNYYDRGNTNWNYGECQCWREVSELFNVTNGVKQGCVLAPTLFSVFLSAMFDEAFRDVGYGVHTIQTERLPIQRRTLQSEDQYYSEADEIAAIRRWRCTGCTLR